MKKYIILIITVFVLFSSCKEEVQFNPLTSAEISGTRLWERISSEGDYSTYSFWPGHEGINPGQAPHGVYHRIYINNNLKESLPNENKIAPFGSIIVKENFNIDQKVVKITVMAKVEGFNDEGGNWFWAAYSPEGEVQAEGTPKGCVSCHVGMKNNDYIIVRPLDYKN
jgi:hypothetical protein